MMITLYPVKKDHTKDIGRGMDLSGYHTTSLWGPRYKLHNIDVPEKKFFCQNRFSNHSFIYLINGLKLQISSKWVRIVYDI